ncbi:MAG: MFS transporter, partial [Pelosinus sp.]|nr:MFS transporter [Pelosinus sp.]
MDERAVADSARKKAYVNIILPLFIVSVIAYIDRVNISYAALTMNTDLGFSAQVFGMGAGVFFIGYVLLEIPGAIIAEKFSPKKWLARIMISWGMVSALMAFMTTQWEFYIIRFLLGAAEASLYPVMYASCVPRWFSPKERAYALGVLLTSMQVSAIIGAPLASSLLGVSLWGLKGWQVLFVLEAIPAVVFGFIIIWWMADKPAEARWLTNEEKEFLTRRYQEEVAVKTAVKKYSVLDAFKDREVLKLCLIYFLWITGFWGFNYWMP